jgi:hypothetical protein
MGQIEDQARGFTIGEIAQLPNHREDTNRAESSDGQGLDGDRSTASANCVGC